jgi:hypothetical protein
MLSEAGADVLISVKLSVVGLVFTLLPLVVALFPLPLTEQPTKNTRDKTTEIILKKLFICSPE